MARIKMVLVFSCFLGWNAFAEQAPAHDCGLYAERNAGVFFTWDVKVHSGDLSRGLIFLVNRNSDEFSTVNWQSLTQEEKQRYTGYYFYGIRYRNEAPVETLAGMVNLDGSLRVTGVGGRYSMTALTGPLNLDFTCHPNRHY